MFAKSSPHLKNNFIVICPYCNGQTGYIELLIQITGSVLPDSCFLNSKKNIYDFVFFREDFIPPHL